MCFPKNRSKQGSKLSLGPLKSSPRIPSNIKRVTGGSEQEDKMPAQIRKVKSAREFRETIASAGDKKVVVDFYATWCGPCRTAAPIYKDLAEKYGDNVVAISVDVDELEDVAEGCGVSAMPTFQVYKGGNKVKEFVGAPKKDELEHLFQ